jgi:RNA polymerase subunit RPABC4/transcription elongation factor Spt4
VREIEIRRITIPGQTGQKVSESWWLMAVILANQEAEIRRIEGTKLPGEVVCETLSPKPHREEGLVECLKV